MCIIVCRYIRFHGNKELWLMREEEQFLLIVAQNELYEVEPWCASIVQNFLLSSSLVLL